MSELLGRTFLRALHDAGQRLMHAEDGSDSREASDAAVEALRHAASVLTAGKGEVVVTAGEAGFYLETALLPHASTEFDNLLRSMRSRGIDTVTIIRDATRADLADLAALVSGASTDIPAEGTVRLNERPHRPGEMEDGPVSGLRKTYSDSLDTLRSVSRGEPLQLGEVMHVVDGFLADSTAAAGPSLLLATIQNHDEVTYYHSVNACLLSLAFGRYVGFDHEDLRLLGLGALLHDVGRVVIDEAALNNPGRLTNEEWAQVRLHPQEGAMTIMAAAGPGQDIAAAVALEHHARMDGGGYPDLGGRAPHTFSRMVSIVDAYDAITSHRPYRPARTPGEALSILLDGAGPQYDADLVRLFIEMMGVHPPGSLLRLSDGAVVMVVSGHEAVLVRRPDGEAVEPPEPFSLEGNDIDAQVLPSEAGVDPAAMLEAVEGSRAG
jgi:HD-GYP domain-containing protein (c-di-GMP phosphodiesterase class II)